jgi:hypothetical protein
MLLRQKRQMHTSHCVLPRYAANRLLAQASAFSAGRAWQRG